MQEIATVAQRLPQPYEILWGQNSAAAIIAIAPALLVATFLQKYLTRGLTMGAIK